MVTKKNSRNPWAWIPTLYFAEGLPNVIVTPHMAFYTEEDVRNMVRSSTGALLAFSRGEDSPFEVK